MELQFQPEYVIQQPKTPLRHKIRERIRQTYRYDTAFWRISMAGPCGVGIFAFALAALGMPTGLGAAFDMASFAFVGTAALFMTAHFIALILALIGLPAPRLYIGAILFDLAAVFLIFYQEDNAFAISATVSSILTLTGILAGMGIGLFASCGVPPRFKTVLAAVLVLGILSAAVWPDHRTDAVDMPALADSADETAADAADGPGLIAIPAEDPSEPGPYEIKEFYYGSGKNAWQPEFGEKADLISEPVDASAYIKKWSKFRTVYWGFNEKALPVNGRVWMPEEPGSFPLVLIVHGNHLMEDYSDDGYAYLGELLASRGFIAVSVDENFLNYSVWTGIPDNDMKVRAWMLLKHLQQIGKFAETPDTPFYDRVDFGKIALVGHSRGGQAVSMATDYKRWFGTDNTLKDIAQYQIRAVAAIAPTDKKVDGVFAKLKNVNYLTLQGARDGDVTDFDGDRQYARTGFTKGEPAFKSSLYIADANHSQFNSDWGGRDASFPKGILLSRSGMLSPKDQRQIAKVYISAFMETTLHRQEQYIPLFQDYRAGLSWLPETAYYNRYESGLMTAWAKYDEDLNRMTLPGGGTAKGNNVDWKEEEAKNRRLSGKDTRGVILERTVDSDEASTYTLSWEKNKPAPGSIGAELLSFSMSDRSYEMENGPGEDPEEQLQIEVELETSEGVVTRLPLTEFMPVLPLPEINYTLHPWLDLNLSDGKYKNPTEAVFQTYRLPLSAFREADPEFDPSSGIARLIFRLTGGQGRIMLDDIGIY